MAASSQDRTILDDRSFFFVLVALVQDSVDAPQRAPSLAGLLYNVGFAERIGATLQGTALLLLVALGLDVRERSPHVRNAARDALTVATIHGPPELEALRALPVFDDPSYAAATLEVAKILSDLSAESGRPIHSSWHLHSIYEAELQKFFAAELRRIQGTVITPNLRLSLQLSCDEWVRQAHGLIAQDHFGEPPRGAAYDKIQEIFGNAGGLLTELTRRCSQTARGRTIGQVAQDAPLVRSARAAMSAWLTAMGGPAWLVDPIRARVAEVNA